MNFNIKDLDIKIRGNDKKEIFKILMILVLINVVITVVVVIFANVEILTTILLYIMSVVYVGTVIYIIKKENEGVMAKPKEGFENKYDPILTRFLIKNEFILDNELLNAEIYYLIKKGYVEIDKENNMLRLKDRTKFKQIDALERINSDKIKEYSTDEIPSYESMFIGKILFAFHDEIGLNEFRKNQRENYYLQRGEMCKLAMEKMLLYEIEKKNMMGQSSNFNFISIAGILNIITSIMLFMVIGRFNIVLLLATIMNIALNAVIIKNENILAYKYSEDVIKYIDNLLEYVDILKKEKITQINNSTYTGEHVNTTGVLGALEGTTSSLHNYEKLDSNPNNEVSENNEENEEMTNQRNTDEELKFLFGINTSEDLFI